MKPKLHFLFPFTLLRGGQCQQQQQQEQPSNHSNSPGLPFVINTWGGAFTTATDAAYLALRHSSSSSSNKKPVSALDAVEIGCAACERHQCDGTVGYGGSPDEACETTLDALLMDGTTMNSGAVASLRNVRHAAAVARLVLDHTAHSLLVGDQATAFALQNGFRPQSLTTPDSAAKCNAWRSAHCQPNFRVDVVPDASSSCGPYHYAEAPVSPEPQSLAADSRSSAHDTLSIMAIDASGALAAGTTTNGASHKIPGRVGDGPIAGSGSYVDGEVGACGATGDGDIMMRFLPCYQAVESLRRGMTPIAAAEDAVRRMTRRFPDLQAGIVVVDREGRHGAAASGWTFTYAFRGGDMGASEVVSVPSLEPEAQTEL